MNTLRGHTKITENDVDTIFRLTVKGNTLDEICAITGLAEETVRSVSRKYFPFVQDIDFHKEHKADIFNAVQQSALAHIMMKIPHAHFKDLVTLIGVLEDKINIREGRPTELVGMSVKIESVVERKERLKSELISKGAIGVEVERKLIEHCEGIVDGATVQLDAMAEALNAAEGVLNPSSLPLQDCRQGVFFTTDGQVKA